MCVCVGGSDGEAMVTQVQKGNSLYTVYVCHTKVRRQLCMVEFLLKRHNRGGCIRSIIE